MAKAEGKSTISNISAQPHSEAAPYQALQALARCTILLNTAYLLKESFGQLWSYEREGWARRFFENWRAALKWQRLGPYQFRRDDRSPLGRNRRLLQARDNKVSSGLWVCGRSQQTRSASSSAAHTDCATRNILRLKILPASHASGPLECPKIIHTTSGNPKYQTPSV